MTLRGFRCVVDLLPSDLQGQGTKQSVDSSAFSSTRKFRFVSGAQVSVRSQDKGMQVG